MLGERSQLLERSDELRVAAELTADAADGRGHALAVLGPAGIGKTELLAAIRANAEHGGTKVLAAKGAELEADLPFGVVRQLLEPTLERASPDRRDHLLRGAARLAETLMGSAPQSYEPSSAGKGSPAFATLHGLYWLVANLAEEQPLVLSIDDAHWADTARCGSWPT